MGEFIENVICRDGKYLVRSYKMGRWLEIKKGREAPVLRLLQLFRYWCCKLMATNLVNVCGSRTAMSAIILRSTTTLAFFKPFTSLL